jgi:Transcription termination factor nusG
MSRLSELNMAAMLPAATDISFSPPELLTDPPHDKLLRQWCVARTLARQEKSLARDLRRQDVPYYLPLEVRKLTYHRRTAWSYVPVISGVVFIFANADERDVCQKNERVVSILKVKNQDEFRRNLLQVAMILSDKRHSPMPSSRDQHLRITDDPSSVVGATMIQDLSWCHTALLELLK